MPLISSKPPLQRSPYATSCNSTKKYFLHKGNIINTFCIHRKYESSVDSTLQRQKANNLYWILRGVSNSPSGITAEKSQLTIAAPDTPSHTKADEEVTSKAGYNPYLERCIQCFETALNIQSPPDERISQSLFCSQKVKANTRLKSANHNWSNISYIGKRSIHTKRST